MSKITLLLALAAVLALIQSTRAADRVASAVLLSEFIYERAPFPSCHASTVAETPDGIVAAWFGGTDEGEKDVGIWFSRHDGKTWSAPVEVANGVDGVNRYPCWNPVLHQVKDGPLVLFYKVGPSPDAWWGMRITSADHGRTWSKPVRLGKGNLGPVKNKAIVLTDGALLCPSSTEHDGWKVHLELSSDLCDTARHIVPPQDTRKLGIIQPALLAWPGGKMQMLCRSRQGKIAESWSEDGGLTWTNVRLAKLPNPNSGLDAVMLKEGIALLVYNDTPRGRSPLNVAVSADGVNWTPGPVLENTPGEYSYPAVIQASDGKVHITYTWKRQRIRHVVIDPALLPRPEESAR